MSDFGIVPAIKKWGIIYALCLPAFVVACFILIGKVSINRFAYSEMILIVIYSLLTALKAGILEEMLFRGYIMKLLESKWNKYVAVLLPSFLFSLSHVPAMETISLWGVLLLILSGTLVGIMFSLIAYKGKSISNNILLHVVWNFILVTDILHITTIQDAYGTPIFSITIPADNILLTGAGFGVEASAVAIIGYLLICSLTLFLKKK